METTFKLSEEEVSELLHIVRSYRALQSQATWLTTQIQELSQRLTEVEAEYTDINAKEETLYESLQEKHGMDRNSVVEIVAKHAITG
jgi:uncharacterized protein (DUF3084 family)